MFFASFLSWYVIRVNRIGYKYNTLYLLIRYTMYLFLMYISKPLQILMVTEIFNNYIHHKQYQKKMVYISKPL